MGRKKKEAQLEMADVTKILDFDRVAETSQMEKEDVESTRQYERRGKLKKSVPQESCSNNTGAKDVSDSRLFDMTLKCHVHD